MSGRFEAQETGFDGLTLLKRKVLGDDRGFLSRLFCASDLTSFGWTGGIAQINETGTTHRATVRGLHFQRPPFAEIKLVTCTRGAVFDVAVDLREGSPTFLKSYAIELSDENGLSLMIPKGFAHGFQALTDEVRMIYAHSEPFAAEAEGGLHCQDPALSIDWPLPVSLLSPRDAAHPYLMTAFPGIAA